MKGLIIGIMVLLCGNVLACQYGMDSSERMNEVIHKAYPNATDVTVDDLQDITFSLSSIFPPNDCPTDFRLSGHLKFAIDGKICKGKIILKYQDDEFTSGKIRFVFCRRI